MRKLWTSEEIEYLKSNYADTNTADICKHLDRSISSVFGMVSTMGLNKSEAFRNSPLSGRLRPGSNIGGSSRFKKGATAFNKGKKQSEFMTQEAIDRSKATRFKKGQKPHNTKSDGHISVRYSKGRPYVWIRTAEKQWEELHRVVWRKTMGEIPSGYNVQFKDKNSTNCEPGNLYIIDRHNQMIQNSIIRFDPELRSLIHLTAKLKRKLKSYEKQD